MPDLSSLLSEIHNLKNMIEGLMVRSQILSPRLAVYSRLWHRDIVPARRARLHGLAGR
jgi:hypothetical protein